MAILHDVVFDCRHPASLARFWAAVLDGYDVAPYDEAELAALASIGVFDPEDDPGVIVEKPGSTPRLYFQKVPEPKTVKNRLHIDVRCADVDAELDRLRSLGARVLTERERWITLADPEDNEFCVLRPGSDDPGALA
jgi:hypothetical protein